MINQSINQSIKTNLLYNAICRRQITGALCKSHSQMEVRGAVQIYLWVVGLLNLWVGMNMEAERLLDDTSAKIQN